MTSASAFAFAFSSLATRHSDLTSVWLCSPHKFVDFLLKTKMLLVLDVLRQYCLVYKASSDLRSGLPLHLEVALSDRAGLSPTVS